MSRRRVEEILRELRGLETLAALVRELLDERVRELADRLRDR